MGTSVFFMGLSWSLRNLRRILLEDHPGTQVQVLMCKNLVVANVGKPLDLVVSCISVCLGTLCAKGVMIELEIRMFVENVMRSWLEEPSLWKNLSKLWLDRENTFLCENDLL